MGVTLTKIVEKMELRNLTPDVDMTQREVKIPDINRPALQLAGFFDHFDCERIQLIGYVEYTYLQTLEYEHKMKIYDTLLDYGIPCFIFCRNLQPDPEFLDKTDDGRGSNASGAGWKAGPSGSGFTFSSVLWKSAGQ